MAVVFVDTGTDIAARALFELDLEGGTEATASGFYIGWGTGGGTSTATEGNVDLAIRATEVLVSATTESVSGDTITWIGRITNQEVGGKVISEAALFIDATGTATDMIIIGDFGDITVATDDVIEFTFTLQYTNG